VWQVIGKFHPVAAKIADGHYSRRKPGTPQFMPPGQTLILLSDAADAIFGWWRPQPGTVPSMNGLDGWTCTIFRNTGPTLSSTMILEAERILLDRYDIGPDGLMTYVWDKKVRSTNPGYCFKRAGYRAVGRSADGRKTLLRKYPNGRSVGRDEQTLRLRTEKMTKLFEGTSAAALTANGKQGQEIQTSFADSLIAGVRESRAVTPVAGGKPFLRLSRSGQLVFGVSSDPVQEGSDWAINPHSIGHGWVCWANIGPGQPSVANKLLGEAMAPITQRKPLQPEAISGGEWKSQYGFDLKCLTGDDEGLEVQYKVNSLGGVRAVDNLLGRCTDHWLKDKLNIVPIVQITSDYYDNKTYGGQTYFPVFTITGWADIFGNQVDDAAPAITDETPPADVVDEPTRTKAPLVKPATVGATPRRQRPGGRV
jgi:hypothetical protein